MTNTAWKTTLAVLTVFGGGCDTVDAPARQTAATPASFEDIVQSCLPDGAGYLQTSLAGSPEQSIDWPNSGTQCEGMARPDGSGVRVTMFFIRPIPGPGCRFSSG